MGRSLNEDLEEIKKALDNQDLDHAAAVKALRICVAAVGARAKNDSRFDHLIFVVRNILDGDKWGVT